MPFTVHDKLVCAMRELALRRSAYPRFVANKRMSQANADREIALMEAIAHDYGTLADREAETLKGR